MILGLGKTHTIAISTTDTLLSFAAVNLLSCSNKNVLLQMYLCLIFSNASL